MRRASSSSSQASSVSTIESIDPSRPTPPYPCSGCVPAACARRVSRTLGRSSSEKLTMSFAAGLESAAMRSTCASAPAVADSPPSMPSRRSVSRSSRVGQREDAQVAAREVREDLPSRTRAAQRRRATGAARRDRARARGRAAAWPATASAAPGPARASTAGAPGRRRRDRRSAACPAPSTPPGPRRPRGSAFGTPPSSSASFGTRRRAPRRRPGRAAISIRSRGAA